MPRLAPQSWQVIFVTIRALEVITEFALNVRKLTIASREWVNDDRQPMARSRIFSVMCKN